MKNPIKPFYKDQDTELYLGDAIDIIPRLDANIKVIVTDPVWPNIPKGMLQGSNNPFGLLKDTLAALPNSISSLIIQVGCDSDPRFLSAVPEKYSFYRSCWLGYSDANIKHDKIIDGNIAYIFGKPTVIEKTPNIALPGYFFQQEQKMKVHWHPCPRQIDHVQWLIKTFVSRESIILDPFVGSGTTLIAAKMLGIRSIGIEIEESFAEKTMQRLKNFSLI